MRRASGTPEMTSPSVEAKEKTYEQSLAGESHQEGIVY
jgi:hypothetical protein